MIVVVEPMEHYTALVMLLSSHSDVRPSRHSQPGPGHQPSSGGGQLMPVLSDHPLLLLSMENYIVNKYHLRQQSLSIENLIRN